MAEEEGGQEVLFTENSGDRNPDGRNARVGAAKAKAKAKAAPKGKEGLAAEMLQQLQSGEDLTSGGNLERLQSYLDDQLKNLDQALSLYAGKGVARYQGTATPAQLRKEMLYLGRFIEAHSIHKTEHGLAEEDILEGGVLFVKLTETSNNMPEDSLDIYNERLKLQARIEEMEAVELGYKNLQSEVDASNPAKMNEEEKKELGLKIEKIKKDKLENKELAKMNVDSNSKIKRLLGNRVSDEQKEELRAHLVDLVCDQIIDWAVRTAAKSKKPLEVLQFLTSGTIGQQLWVILQYTGMALSSFGPKKLLKDEPFAPKAKSKARAKEKAIKTTQAGEKVLSAMKGKLPQVMEMLQGATRLELSYNTLVGACAEVCLLSGCDDKGRGLLAFRFKSEHESVRKMVYARSIAQLTMSDRQKSFEQTKEIVRVSGIVEALQRRSPCEFLVAPLPAEVSAYLERIPVINSLATSSECAAKNFRDGSMEQFDVAFAWVTFVKRAIIEKAVKQIGNVDF